MSERTYNYRFLADAAPFAKGDVASPETIEGHGLTVKDLWAKSLIDVTGEAPTTEVADAAGNQPE